MHTYCKKIFLYTGIFIITLLGLWLLLIGAAMIPNERIKENMQVSAYAYGQTEAFAFCDGDKWNGIADNYADAIWLNVAWYMGKDNPVKATMDTKYYNGEEQGVNAGLYLAVTQDSTKANTEYTRYWHGTAGVIRLLHLFTDVKGMKNIGLCCICLLAATVTVLLIKDKKGTLAAGFVLSLCCVEFWKTGLSIEYQPAFFLSLLMCIFYLLLEKKGNTWLTGLSVAGGVSIAFFDFLTTEIMVLLLPLILVVAVRSLEKRLGTFKESMQWILSCGLAWSLSYIMTFLTKWVLASVILGTNQILTAMASVEERVSGPTQEIMSEEMPLSIYGVLSNLSVFFGAKIRTDVRIAVFGSVMFLGFFFSVYYLFQKKNRDKTAVKYLLLLGSMVFLRYLILGNHSYLHCFFTYRGLMIPALAFFSILAINCELPQRKSSRKRKKQK